MKATTRKLTTFSLQHPEYDQNATKDLMDINTLETAFSVFEMIKVFGQFHLMLQQEVVAFSTLSSVYIQRILIHRR